MTSLPWLALLPQRRARRTLTADTRGANMIWLVWIPLACTSPRGSGGEDPGREGDSGAEAGPPVRQINGPSEGARLGRAAVTGDFDGDGLTDLALGAYGGDGELGLAGSVLVYTGAHLQGTSSPVLTNPDGVLTDGVADASFGLALARGDLDRDGFDDLVVGAPGADDGQGAVYVYLGAGGGLGVLAPQRIAGADGEHLGAALAVGDWTGEGAPDLAVGAPDAVGEDGEEGAGRVDLYLEGALAAEGPTRSYPGEEALLRLGASLADLGDVTGDGIDDLGVGTKIAYDIDAVPLEAPTDHPGELHVLAGASLGMGEDAAAVLVGDDALDDFGLGFAGVGDLDQDGVDDLVVGAGHYYHQFVEGATEDLMHGRAYLYRGGPGLAGALGTGDADLTLVSDVVSGGFGFFVAGPGDLTGDGAPDVLVSAPATNDGAGLVTLFDGLPDVTVPSYSWFYGYRLGFLGEAALRLPRADGDCSDWLVLTAYVASPHGAGDQEAITAEDPGPSGVAAPPEDALHQAGAAFLVPAGACL